MLNTTDYRHISRSSYVIQANDHTNFFFQVVFDQQSQKGVAIIEINNPHITLTDIKGLVLCDDICHNVDWMNYLERQTIIDGYIYCCDLNNFEFGLAFKNGSPFPKATGGILRDGSINKG